MPEPDSFVKHSLNQSFDNSCYRVSDAPAKSWGQRAYLVVCYLFIHESGIHELSHRHVAQPELENCHQEPLSQRISRYLDLKPRRS